MSHSDRTSMGGAGSEARTTRWSVILAARTQDESRRKLALENLAGAYWKPIYCYLRRDGQSDATAKDLTQEFFREFFLEGKLLEAADRELGGFRQLLRTALKRFVSNVKRDQLAESLPWDAGLARMLPNIVTLVCEKFRPFTGCSFGALLADAETDVLVLETIKDLHKKQAESAPAGPRQEVATAIYYAAIASALVHRETRITKLSYESLSRSFEELARSDWLPTDLKHLLGEAHGRCARHLSKSEKGVEGQGRIPGETGGCR